MTKIIVAGNEVVISQPVRWMKHPHLVLKRFTPSETKAQAKQRLKLAQEAHALRDKVEGFMMYRGRSIPAVSAIVAGKITGHTSPYATREEWYKAHRPTDEAVRASIDRLKRLAGEA